MHHLVDNDVTQHVACQAPTVAYSIQSVCWMLLNVNRLLLLALPVALGNCDADHSRPPARVRPTPSVAQGQEPLPQVPAPADSGLTGWLEPIRANFRRINTIRRWSAAVNRGLDEPGEGGEATFYYANGRLEKIEARHYGEMGQRRVYYYLLSGQPSFVLERSYRYNRPLYYDSAVMREAHDTQAFAFDSSEVEEQRSYFVQGRLVHRLPRPAPGAPAAQFLRQEQDRIKAEFRAVLNSR